MRRWHAIERARWTSLVLALFLSVGIVPACALLAPPALSVRVTRVDAHEFPSVSCFVSVVDETGESVLHLPGAGFRVVEDGRTVGRLRFSTIFPPHSRIAVILVLDRSGSMRGAPIAAAKEAARVFLGSLSERDLLTLVTFASKAEAAAELSVSRDEVLTTLARTVPHGETALYDAVGIALAKLAGIEADRKAAVVLTDGCDNASKSTASQCTASAARDGIALYCVGLGRSINRETLMDMAAETAGYCFFTHAPADLTSIYRKIAHQIQSQYILTYESAGPSVKQSWHTVQVTVTHRGMAGTDRRQYVRPSETVSGRWRFLTGLLYPVLACMALLDILLAAAVLRRKFSGRA